jgi:CheY-like chemotaxis protein
MEAKMSANDELDYKDLSSEALCPRTFEEPQSTGSGAPVVLILDDDPMIAEMHGRSLRRAGFHVEVCTNSSSALVRFAAGERFDVVICDGRMPEVRGVELLRRVSAAWPEIERRIIFVSGGLPDDDLHFIREHHLPLLWKPLRHIEELEVKVRELIAHEGVVR